MKLSTKYHNLLIPQDLDWWVTVDCGREKLRNEAMIAKNRITPNKRYFELCFHDNSRGNYYTYRVYEEPNHSVNKMLEKMKQGLFPNIIPEAFCVWPYYDKIVLALGGNPLVRKPVTA